MTSFAFRKHMSVMTNLELTRTRRRSVLVHEWCIGKQKSSAATVWAV